MPPKFLALANIFRTLHETHTCMHTYLYVCICLGTSAWEYKINFKKEFTDSVTSGSLIPDRFLRNCPSVLCSIWVVIFSYVVFSYTINRQFHLYSLPAFSAQFICIYALVNSSRNSERLPLFKESVLLTKMYPTSLTSGKYPTVYFQFRIKNRQKKNPTQS